MMKVVSLTSFINFNLLQSTIDATQPIFFSLHLNPAIHGIWECLHTASSIFNVLVNVNEVVPGDFIPMRCFPEKWITDRLSFPWCSEFISTVLFVANLIISISNIIEEIGIRVPIMRSEFEFIKSWEVAYIPRVDKILLSEILYTNWCLYSHEITSYPEWIFEPFYLLTMSA